MDLNESLNRYFVYKRNLFFMDPVGQYPQLTSEEVLSEYSIILDWLVEFKEDCSITVPLSKYLDARYCMGTYPINIDKNRSTPGYDSNTGTYFDRRTGIYIYPGDPPNYPCVSVEIRDYKVYLYPYGFVAVVPFNTAVDEDIWLVRMD